MTLKTIALAAIALPVLFGQTDWPGYSKDSTGQRYSPPSSRSTRRTSASSSWPGSTGSTTSGPAREPRGRGGSIATTEAVPIMVGRRPSIRRPRTIPIVALEPETGKELWKYDLGRAGAPLAASPWSGIQEHPAADHGGNQRGQADRPQREDRPARARLRQRRQSRFASRRGGQVSQCSPYHMSSPGAHL